MTRSVEHLRATLLPFGEAPVDLWIVDGTITFVPRPGAREVAAPDGYLAPGLVDAHTHLHFVPDPASKQGRSVIDENRRRHLEAGSLLLRDLGATTDDVLNLPEDDGLPIVQAAAQGLLVEPRHPFFVTAAKELPGAARQQARAGARWVKVFADWPGWPGTQEEPNFGGHDRLTYPSETLAEAVRAAHEGGARVAIHAFGREAAAAGIEAGVDSIEHGWGLDEGLVEAMAAKRIGWTPMLAIAAPMLRSAERDANPDREQAQWIRASLAAMKTLLPRAVRAGVPVLAGTDWFPAVTLAEEVALLHEFGLDAREALAAATSVARDFLGAPGLTEGAPADLVLFRSDPRLRLAELARPELVMMRGRALRAAAA